MKGNSGQAQPSAKKVPGKSTLTAKLERDTEHTAGARPQAAPGTAAGAAPRGRSNADFTDDVWMDAALRGSVAFTARGLDPGHSGEITPGEPAAAGPVQREGAAATISLDQASTLARVRQTRDIDDIKEVDDFGPASTSAAPSSMQLPRSSSSSGSHVDCRQLVPGTSG